ncbi:MAG: FimV/HubP family polar landmark protein, partial [Rhodanobacter sp.]
MNRSLKLSMLVALALGSSQLLAVDFGQLQVKSALGQPLLAEIPLHPSSPAELKSLSVKLASSEQFARAGIVGGRTSIPLHFSIANSASQQPVIRITSSVPVDDPYLDLLLEVNGKAGSSVREYAILLDPPGMQAAMVANAAPEVPRQPAPARAIAAPTRQAVVAAPAPAPSPAPSSVNKGRFGPVQRGQTLTGIARSVAPAGVDVQQMVLALKQANPDAFYRDNINALKSGAVLRVPTSTEAEAVTLAAAVAEVRRQNSDWRAGTPGKPAVVADAATRASASSSPTAAPAGRGDRLALVPARAGGDTTGDAAGGGDKSSAKVREELLRTKESLASLQQQGSDLKTRLKDLTDINSKNEHLLSLKDSQIAELQAKLVAANKAEKPAPAAAEPTAAAAGTSVGASEAPVGAATTALAQTAPAAVSSSGVAAGSSAATAASTATAVTTAVASTAPAKPAAVDAAHKHAPTSVPVGVRPWYMQIWTWIAGLAVLVLLIVLGMLGGRRKPAANAGPSIADRFSTTPAIDDNLPDADDTDQEQLLDQLAEHPDDIYLHLELVTLYYSRRDTERFEAAAEAMYVHITSPEQDEWQDVVHMGEDLAPEHPLFDHHEEVPAPEAEAGQAFNIDDYQGERDASPAVSSLPPDLPGEPKKVSEYNFKFDLTHPAATELHSPLPTAADDVTAVEPHDEADAWMTPEAEAPPATDFA